MGLEIAECRASLIRVGIRGPLPCRGIEASATGSAPARASALLQFLDHAGRLGLGHVVVDLAAASNTTRPVCAK
jgi:hypothetical protein